MSDTLIGRIMVVDKTAGETFNEIGLSHEEILNVQREDLLEIFPGNTNFKRRKVLISTIEQFKEKPPLAPEDASSSRMQQDNEENLSSSSSSSLSYSFSSTASTEVYLSGEEQRRSMHNQSPILKDVGIIGALNEKKKLINFAKTSQLQTPKYLMYQDEPVTTASKSGSIPIELHHRLIRGTVHCMIAVSSAPPFNRYPTSDELREMAKSLVLEYPAINCKETGHGKVFKQLKARLKNIKPVKQPQGPCLKKRRTQKTIHKPVEPNDADGESSESAEESTENTTDDIPQIMDKHYKYLAKECAKKNPSAPVIKLYLDLEHPARQLWIKTLVLKDRWRKIVESYSCFTEPEHLVEEIKRITSSKLPSPLLQTSCDAFEKEIDSIIYYGISRGYLQPPKPSKYEKVLYLLKNIHVVFPNKKKKPTEIICEIQESDDPEAVIKNQSVMPFIIVNGRQEIILFCGRHIVCRWPLEDIVVIFVTYMALFYIMDLDYPAAHEVGFTILQFILFEDKKTPPDLIKALDAVFTDYNNYK